MIKCENCSNNITLGEIMGCSNCGFVVCASCAQTTKKICPKCYSDLEYIG